MASAAPSTSPCPSCDYCGAACLRAGWGWRGYIVVVEGIPSVAIVCPACAEARHGEDEAPTG